MICQFKFYFHLVQSALTFRISVSLSYFFGYSSSINYVHDITCPYFLFPCPTEISSTSICSLILEVCFVLDSPGYIHHFVFSSFVTSENHMLWLAGHTDCTLSLQGGWQVPLHANTLFAKSHLIPIFSDIIFVSWVCTNFCSRYENPSNLLILNRFLSLWILLEKQ